MTLVQIFTCAGPSIEKTTLVKGFSPTVLEKELDIQECPTLHVHLHRNKAKAAGAGVAFSSEQNKVLSFPQGSRVLIITAAFFS